MPLTLQTYPSVQEATAALARPGARYLGGGTLVVRAANEGDVDLSNFVRVTAPSLSEIEIADSRVRIGASVTMAAVARHPELTAIAAAAKAVGGPAIRNMATVGGNLFAPAPYGDFAVALLALGASVAIEGEEMPVEAFLRERESVTGVVTGVAFDLPSAGTFRFAKISRVKPKGISVLSIGAVLEEDADGTITAARIALGCMADRPIRARAAEAALIGRRRDAAGIADALAVANQGTSPVTDPIASAWYRAEVLPVHLGRLLLS
jgi:CO/xanthine dehydrogenase FAD-binding subunit